jgi:hypothetical protein
MHINFTGITGSLKSPQILLGNLKKDLKNTLHFFSFFFTLQLIFAGIVGNMQSP